MIDLLSFGSGAAVGAVVAFLLTAAAVKRWIDDLKATITRLYAEQTQAVLAAGLYKRQLNNYFPDALVEDPFETEWFTRSTHEDAAHAALDAEFAAGVRDGAGEGWFYAKHTLIPEWAEEQILGDLVPKRRENRG